MKEEELSETPISRRFLAALALAATMAPLNSTMIAVALPTIRQSLGVSLGTLTVWLVTSYLIVNIVSQSPAGKLGDLLGRRWALGLGQVLFAGGSLLAVCFPRLMGLSLARMSMALGGALIMPSTMAVLRSVIPPEKRARAFGYLGGLIGISAALGPLLGGFLTRYFGWKAIFWVNLPVVLLVWLLLRGVGELGALGASSSRGEGRSFDVPGVVLLAVGLAASVLGLKGVAGYRWLLLVPGLVTLVGFVWWESRVAAPLIELRLFTLVPYVAGGTVVGLMNLCMYALLFQLPFLMEKLLKLGPAGMGRAMLSMMLSMVICAPLGGRLAERLGTRWTVLLGVFSSSLGMLALQRALGLGAGGYTWILLGLACVGCGVGLVMGPAQAASLSAVPKEQSGVAAGMLSTMRYLGGVIGVTLISVVLVSEDTTGLLAESRLCLWIYIGFYGLAATIAMLLPVATRTKPPTTKNDTPSG